MGGVTTLAAVSAMADALSIIVEFSTRLHAASLVIQRAQAEGREINKAEWESLKLAIDESTSKLKTAIDNAG